MKRKIGLLALSAAATIALAACGSGSPSDDSAAGTSSSNGSLTKVSVGVIPIVDVAPIYLGEQEGFFKEQGLDLEFVSAQGGAAIVPAVTSGTMDFGFSNISSMFVAKSKGLDLKVISAGASSTGKDGEDFGGVLVKKGSPISSAADLENKTVAVNTLNNINDTTVRESVRKAGGDPSKIKFVELGFPDMQAALTRGQVDAIQVVEPFLTSGKEAEDELIASNYVDTADQLTIGAYFTTAEKSEKDADMVGKFSTAMSKSLAYANENPDAVRDILPTYTKIDAETAKKLTLPNFASEINRDSVEKLVQLSKADGLIDSDPDLEQLLP